MTEETASWEARLEGKWLKPNLSFLTDWESQREKGHGDGSVCISVLKKVEQHLGLLGPVGFSSSVLCCHSVSVLFFFLKSV